MDLRKIVYSKEDKYIAYNEERARIFLNDFKYYINKDLTKNLGYINYTDLEKFLLLWINILYYYPYYKDIFYKTLIENDFRLPLDIICRLNRPIEDIALSPLINSVDTNKSGLVTIYSDLIGNFSFIKLPNYYHNNKVITSFLENNKLANRCHRVSWKFMSLIEQGKLITLLFPRHFTGTLFHSLVKDENGMYIDLARNIAYDEQSFKLLGAQIISITDKKELLEKLKIVKSQINEMTKREYYEPALLLALYEESKKI